METNKQPRFLTPKQQLFCDEYLTDMNATAAALRAGYSPATALNGALMRIPKIKLYLDERIQANSEKLQINQDMMLRELAKIAFGNMGNYFDADGKVKPMNELDDEQKAALWHVKANDDGTVNLKMYNKLAAMEKIAKMLQFYAPPIVQLPRPVFIDQYEITEDDRFEDDTFETRELQTQEEIEFFDTDGTPLYEEAIAYGPLADVFVFTMQEKPDNMARRLSLYQSMENAIGEYAEENESAIFKCRDMKRELSAWLQRELLQCDVEVSGDTIDDIDNQFRMLRNLRRKGGSFSVR